MSRLLEAVAHAHDARLDSERAFREALRAAHGPHSWRELAEVTGLTRANVRYLAHNLNDRRKPRERKTDGR